MEFTLGDLHRKIGYSLHFMLSFRSTCDQKTKLNQWNTEASNPEQRELEQQVRNLLSWYQAKQQALSSCSLVNKPVKEGERYTVNDEQAGQFLKTIKQSGLFTTAYVESMRAHFKSCNDAFIHTSQSDGPPKGLEYDLIFLTRDMEETRKSMDKPLFKQFTRKDDRASIDVKLVEGLRITYIRVKGKWLVDKIATLAP